MFKIQWCVQFRCLYFLSSDDSTPNVWNWLRGIQGPEPAVQEEKETTPFLLGAWPGTPEHRRLALVTLHFHICRPMVWIHFFSLLTACILLLLLRCFTLGSLGYTPARLKPCIAHSCRVWYLQPQTHRKIPKIEPKLKSSIITESY